MSAAVEVRGVSKRFRLRHERYHSFQELAVNLFRRSRSTEQFWALKDVSFTVEQGRSFGIVGENGSGKSTLLKMVAGVLIPDEGSVRVRGDVAPLIEVTGGFIGDLTARDNVVLNGVMMGLSRREARRRLDAVLDFAGLREFADLKLKNYSSGMMVRLAFAVVVEAEADIMLVDEVLAVGDAEFAQKCMDVFEHRRRAGRTVVLVTHDMSTVERMCDRALLLERGELAYLGDPQETALRYFRVNFAREHASPDPDPSGGIWDVNVRPVDAWLENRAGERVENVEQGEPIGLRIVVEARHELASPVFGVHFVDTRGITVFGFNRQLANGGRVAPGGRVRIGGTVENRLLPGRYFVECFVARSREQGDIALHRLRLLDFAVNGAAEGKGIVAVDADVEAEVEP